MLSHFVGHATKPLETPAQDMLSSLPETEGQTLPPVDIYRQNIDRADGTGKQRQKEEREKELSNSNAPDVASTSTSAAAAAAASAAAAAMMFAGRSGQSQYWWPGALHFRHGFGQSLCLCPTPRQL